MSPWFSRISRPPWWQRYVRPLRLPVRSISGLQRLADRDSDGCLGLSWPGGVPQPGRHFVPVSCLLVACWVGCLIGTKSAGNTQSAVNYMLSVWSSIYIQSTRLMRTGNDCLQRRLSLRNHRSQVPHAAVDLYRSAVSSGSLIELSSSCVYSPKFPSPKNQELIEQLVSSAMSSTSRRWWSCLTSC